MKRSSDGMQLINADLLQIKKTKFNTTDFVADVSFPSGTYTVAKTSDIGVLPVDIVREATVQTITNKDLSSNTNILPSDIVRTTEDDAVNITNGDQSTSTSTGALIVAGGLGVGKNTHFGGTIHVPVGTATAPTFSFSNNSTTGMYLVSTNALGFSTNGILRQTIDTTRITTTIPIQLPSVGGIASNLDHYEVWNSAITFFYSITNSFQWIINIVRIGKNVTYHFGDDANLYTIANGPRQITCAAGSIPTRFRPASNIATPYLYLQFNAPSTFTWTSGKIIINSDGSISLSPQNSNFNSGDQLYIQRHSTTIFAA